MNGKKKSRIKKETKIQLAIVAIGVLMFFSNYMRVKTGYFNSAIWITLSGVFSSLFFAVATGYFVAKLMGSKKW